MSDGKKSCLGFGFLILGLGLAVVFLLAGGIGEAITFITGEPSGMNFKIGFYVAVALLAISFVMALAFFLTVKDWAWLPAIFGGVYTVMPDLILGPEDDIIAMVSGVVLSGLLAWLKGRHDKRQTSNIE